MIYNKYCSFNALCLLIIFVLSHLFCRVESFIPLGRLAHSSVLVTDKLYFIGGKEDNEISNKVFYLDVSRPFNTSSPPWVILTTASLGSAWATAAANNINNDTTIYLFGGFVLARCKN